MRFMAVLVLNWGDGGGGGGVVPERINLIVENHEEIGPVSLTEFGCYAGSSYCI